MPHSKKLDSVADSKTTVDEGPDPPKKRGRGRPPGSTNKNKLKDVGVDGVVSSNSSTVADLRKNPDRILKGKGGEVAHKQQISRVIDPTELKAQAGVLAAAKSPIPSSAPLNPYAPASLKPARKKKSKTAAEASTTTFLVPGSNAALVVPNSQATFQTLPNTIPIQGYQYPAYSLPLTASDSMTNVVANTVGAPTMDRALTTRGTAIPSGLAMVLGTPVTAGIAMEAEAPMLTSQPTQSGYIMGNKAPTVTEPALSNSDTLDHGLQQSAASPRSSRYGFQPPSAESVVSETVGMSKESTMDNPDAYHPLNDSLIFDFNIDNDSDLSFINGSSGSSVLGNGSNIVDGNGGSFLPNIQRDWQNPLDLVYVPPNSSSDDSPNAYVYSQQQIEPVQPSAHANSASNNESDVQLSTHLEGELFEIEKEGEELETDDEDEIGSDSDIGSESDDSESDDEEDEKQVEGSQTRNERQSTGYSGPARSPLSRPYAGSVFSLSSAAADHDMKARSVSQPSFIGNLPASYQSVDSFNVSGNAKRKRKPRSNVTAALLRYGSTCMQSPSPSPAPSNISAFSHTSASVPSTRSTFSRTSAPKMPDLTPAPSLISEQNSPPPALSHEDRAFYCEKYQAVYDYARDLSRLSLALENAFPECARLFKEEPEVKLQDLLVKCVDDAIAAFDLQEDAYLQKHKFGIALGISKDRSVFRGDVKTYARKAVASLLSIRKELQKKKKRRRKKKRKGSYCEEEDDEPISPIIQKHRAEVIAKVKDYFKDDKYLLGGTDAYGNHINYGSNVIEKVIRDVFYAHDQKLGFVFEENFKTAVPKRVVALVASAIQCALMEYEKHGYLHTLRFDPKDFAKRYRRHVRGIERLESVPFHKKLFREERKKWAAAHWVSKESVNGTIVDNEQEEPPVHLRLEYYLPPGVVLSYSDSEEE